MASFNDSSCREAEVNQICAVQLVSDFTTLPNKEAQEQLTMDLASLNQVKMSASRHFPVNLLMNKHVPLHKLGGFKVRSKITSEPIFSRRLCGGIPDISRELKNSAGEFQVLFSSTIMSIGLKGIGSYGNNSISGSLFR
ncbi:hypothetical protein TNCV_5046941 [Trichonephila clavipes]|nr:hypothetical protein TNCV_5046941 [Trichonephila clavipes]